MRRLISIGQWTKAMRIRPQTWQLIRTRFHASTIDPVNETIHSPPTTQLQWNLDLTNLYITKPLVNELFSSAGKNYGKMYVTEPKFKEPRFNEILFMTTTIQKRNCKIFLDVTSKYQHVIKDESQTDQHG